MKTGKFLILVALVLAPFAARAVDLSQIERDLGTTGVTGWIHGSVAERGIYVFTYRNPNDFFDYLEMSLVAMTSDMESRLATFGRHDKVTVKGRFLKNPSPQKHIAVDSIELVKKYETTFPTEPYSHEAKIPDDLLHLHSGIFLVHAIGGDGHILVAEYKDAVIPIFVHNGALTRDLYRNDVVKLTFNIQEFPDRPVHLNLDETVPKPVELIDSVKALHGEPASVEGALILFPKSPEIVFNVFAVQDILPSGVKRQYTLVNMDDPAVFKQIRDALQQAWDRHPKDYVNGRNKLVSTRVRVKATGIFNEIDPGQANAQIFLSSASSIQIIE